MDNCELMGFLSGQRSFCIKFYTFFILQIFQGFFLIKKQLMQLRHR